MSEEQPPPNDPYPPGFRPSEPLPERAEEKSGGIGAGILLFVVCAILAIPTHGFSIAFGFVVGFGCLFVRRYRWMLASYFLTGVAAVGLVLLLIIIACSNMRTPSGL